MIQKWLKTLFFFLAPAILFIGATSLVKAQTCSNESDCNKLIEEYTAQIVKLQGQANTLSNQIAQFDVQIKLTTVKITQTEEQIKLLGGRIDQLEGSLGSLSNAFSERAVQTYKMSRSGEPIFLLLNAEDIDKLIASFHYLAKIQEADRNLLIRLQKAQNIYIDEKGKQEELAKQLDAQKKQLNSQKAAKAQLLNVTRSDEKRYQQLLTQAKAQLDRFRRFTASQGGASILSGQTKCNDWGCYYNQRDSQWGNMYLGGTSYLMKDSGCFITSVAMMASHARRNILPSDIAQLSAAVTSGGDLKWTFNVNGTNVSITSASKSELDSRLVNGPVIAGLYGGPDHFVVILRKEGSNYIMHDPFLENGSNRPLTDKYNVSDITTLRIVNFN